MNSRVKSVLDPTTIGNQLTDFDRLIQRGISLPAPETLADHDLHLKLWEVIHGLADLKVYLHNTNHLDDKDLYARLWRTELRKERSLDCPELLHSNHIDLLGRCTEEDLQNYLRYYADESYRLMWSEDFPEDNLPEHEDPAHDRDRLLPISEDKPLL